MREFEVWQLLDIEGNFLYDSSYEGGNKYKFYVEQENAKDAIKKVKEIFKRNFEVEDFLDEKFESNHDYLFSAKINDKIEDFIMFEVE